MTQWRRVESMPNRVSLNIERKGKAWVYWNPRTQVTTQWARDPMGYGFLCRLFSKRGK